MCQNNHQKRIERAIVQNVQSLRERGPGIVLTLKIRLTKNFNTPSVLNYLHHLPSVGCEVMMISTNHSTLLGIFTWPPLCCYEKIFCRGIKGIYTSANMTKSITTMTKSK